VDLTVRFQQVVRIVGRNQGMPVFLRASKSGLRILV
jgi:hypothetical protein